MLARSIARTSSLSARAFASRSGSPPASSGPSNHRIDPELEEILRSPTFDEHALSKYVRNMTPEQMMRIAQDPMFQETIKKQTLQGKIDPALAVHTLNPRGSQPARGTQPPVEKIDPREVRQNAFDDEQLEDYGYPGSYPEEEEEGGMNYPNYDDWDQESESSRSADPLPDPRRRSTARFSDVTDDTMSASSLPPPIQSNRTTGQKRRSELESAMQRYRYGTVKLPELLVKRIADVLDGYPRAWLRKDAKLLSESLRARTVEESKGNTLPTKVDLGKFAVDPVAGPLKAHVKATTPPPPLPYNRRQSLAYVAHRVPEESGIASLSLFNFFPVAIPTGRSFNVSVGIYACNFKAMHELKQRFENFAPSTMLDFGSGPGTAVWAARELWPSLKAFVAVEPSEHMTEVSEVLLKDFPVVRRRYLDHGKKHYYDLVVASYALSEMRDEGARIDIVRELWEHVAAGGVLVLIEPGTPIAFRMVRNARSTILDSFSTNPAIKPKILAPCTHQETCPMGIGDWCHFIQRVQRTPQQLDAKKESRASINFENEKYSYVIAAKGPSPWQESDLQGEHEWARLIRQPIKRGGHVIVDSCTPQASIQRLMISKGTSPVLFRSARKATWGDLYDTNRARESLEEKKLKPKRQWRNIYEERKAKREEKARAAAGSPTIFANITANYATHKLIK